LKLKRNRIKNLPKEYCNLENLKEIDLSENEFNFLPMIITLDKIEKVNLISNYIDDYKIMEDELTKFNYEADKKFNLKFLYLNKNLLTKLPIDFIKDRTFHNLKHMALDENPIKEYTKEIKKIIEENFENVYTFNKDEVELIKDNEYEEESINEENKNKDEDDITEVFTNNNKSNKFLLF